MQIAYKRQFTILANGGQRIHTGRKMASFLLKDKANTVCRHPTQTGMNRLALSDHDVQARNWFSKEMESLGCIVTLDRMGNMFARKQGAAKSPQPMIAMGSHLDTQPRGGRYDGILGVVSAVEVMRTLAEHNYDAHFDVGVVNWTK